MADEKRNRRRGLLKQYYGVKDVDPKEGFDPYNINAPEFNSDLYLHKVLHNTNYFNCNFVTFYSFATLMC